MRRGVSKARSGAGEKNIAVMHVRCLDRTHVLAWTRYRCDFNERGESSVSTYLCCHKRILRETGMRCQVLTIPNTNMSHMGRSDKGVLSEFHGLNGEITH